MKKIEVKIGDKFIYVSKYGGVTLGTIADVFYIVNIDFLTAVKAREWKIKSTNGIVYGLGEIMIVDSFLTESELETLQKKADKIKNIIIHKEENRTKMMYLLRERRMNK